MINRFMVGIMKRIQNYYWNGMYRQYRDKYNISPTFRFNGDHILFYDEGDIICGDNSYIGEKSFIESAKDCKVIVGSNCRISHFVHIYTYNSYADQNFCTNELQIKKGNVIIGDYCWIGIKTSIMGPVTIGENSVIGANSLVNRNIPPNCIAMGVPAKVVKFKSHLSNEEKKLLAEQYQDVLNNDLLYEYINVLKG